MNQSSGNTPENRISADEIMKNLLERIVINSSDLGKSDPDIRFGSNFHILSKSIAQVMVEELYKIKVGEV